MGLREADRSRQAARQAAADTSPAAQDTAARAALGAGGTRLAADLAEEGNRPAALGVAGKLPAALTAEGMPLAALAAEGTRLAAALAAEGKRRAAGRKHPGEDRNRPAAHHRPAGHSQADLAWLLVHSSWQSAEAPHRQLR